MYMQDFVFFKVRIYLSLDLLCNNLKILMWVVVACCIFREILHRDCFCICQNNSIFSFFIFHLNFLRLLIA